MYSDHLENEALEDCESCCCCCVQCKDNIVELNWVDPSWVHIHVLFLCGRQGKGNKEEGEGERIRGTRGRGREGEREKLKWVGCQNRGVEREEGRGGEGREEGVEEESTVRARHNNQMAIPPLSPLPQPLNNHPTKLPHLNCRYPEQSDVEHEVCHEARDVECQEIKVQSHHTSSIEVQKYLRYHQRWRLAFEEEIIQ